MYNTTPPSFSYVVVALLLRGMQRVRAPPPHAGLIFGRSIYVRQIYRTKLGGGEAKRKLYVGAGHFRQRQERQVILHDLLLL